MAQSTGAQSWLGSAGVNHKNTENKLSNNEHARTRTQTHAHNGASISATCTHCTLHALALRAALPRSHSLTLTHVSNQLRSLALLIAATTHTYTPMHTKLFSVRGPWGHLVKIFVPVNVCVYVCVPCVSMCVRVLEWNFGICALCFALFFCGLLATLCAY